MAKFKFLSQLVTSLFKLQMLHSAKRMCLSVFLALPLSDLKPPPIEAHNDFAIWLHYLLLTSLHHCYHLTGLNLYGKNTR